MLERQLRGKLPFVGDLTLTNYPALTSLPPGLEVVGNVVLQDCHGLNGLPDDFKVSGSLRIINCGQLTHLSTLLHVNGALMLSGCGRLRELASQLHVGGDLTVENCAQLVGLPQQLHVGGDYALVACGAVQSLPRELHVEGRCTVMNCAQLTAWSQHHYCAGDMVVGNCTALATLPRGLRASADLLLSNCENFAHLPLGLIVDGGLYLDNLPALSALPVGLRVENELDVRRCVALRQVPEGTRVSGDVTFAACPNLRQLPANFFAQDAGLGRRRVTLSGTAVPPATLQQLTDAVQTDPLGAYPQAHAAPAFADLQAASAHWVAAQGRASRNDDHYVEGEATATLLAPIDFSQWSLVAAQQRDLITFLSRLRGTAEYASLLARPFLAVRVNALLHKMDGDPQLRAACLERIEDAMASCDDRIIMAMNQLELAMRLYEAEQPGRGAKALMSLGVGMMALELVHDQARQKCRELQDVDEVEVFLAYEVNLAGPLKLPISTRHMLFERSAQVRREDLLEAERSVLAAVHDLEQVKTYLQTWAPWQTFVRREAAARLTWHNLPVVELRFAKEPSCPITGDTLGELMQPVAFKKGDNWQICDQEAFLRGWVVNGLDPTHDPTQALQPQRLTLRELYRPQL